MKAVALTLVLVVAGVLAAAFMVHTDGIEPLYVNPPAVQPGPPIR